MTLLSRKSILMVLPFYFIVMVGYGNANSFYTHTETTGNYSGIFYSYESSTGHGWNQDFGGNYVFNQDSQTTTYTVMYPGRTFGLGIEMPFKNKKIRVLGTNYPSHEYVLHGWGDIRLSAKYQFGIYNKFRVGHNQLLLKSVVGIVCKLKLPTGLTTAKDNSNKIFPPRLQLGTGSTDLGLGFIFHTDTRKYFRIQGHFFFSMPLRYKSFHPGKSISYTLSAQLVKLGVKDFFYPFCAVKGRWSMQDRWNGKKLFYSGGNFIALSSGIQSVWLYFDKLRMFHMYEIAFQVPIFEPTGSMLESGPSFYLGTRLFFR